MTRRLGAVLLALIVAACASAPPTPGPSSPGTVSPTATSSVGASSAEPDLGGQAAGGFVSPAPAATAGAPSPTVAPGDAAAAVTIAARLREPFSAKSTDAVEDALARAGIEVTDETGQPPARPLTGSRSSLALLGFQARNLALETATQGGIPGAQLRSLLEMPPDAPTLDQIVAGYVATAPTFGGALSRQLMDGADLTHPERLAFPTITLDLLLADAERAQADTAGHAGTGSAGPVVHPAQMVRTAAGTGVCGAVSDFMTKTMARIADWIVRALPDNIIIKLAVGFAVTAILGKGLDFLTKLLLDLPIVKAIREALGTMALVATVVASLRAWTITMKAAPTQLHYTVGSAEATRGRITAHVNDPTDDLFSPAVRSCATLLQIELPRGGAPGSRVTWTITAGIPGHAFEDPPRTLVVPEDRQLALEFHMNTESDRAHAEGEEQEGAIVAFAKVERQDVREIRRVIQVMIEGTVPGILRPFFADLLNSQGAKLADLANPSAVAYAHVTYHEEPSSTPPPVSPAPCASAAAGRPARLEAGSYRGTVLYTFRFDDPSLKVTHDGKGAITFRVAGGTISGAWGLSYLATAAFTRRTVTAHGSILDATVAGRPDRLLLSGTTHIDTSDIPQEYVQMFQDFPLVNLPLTVTSACGGHVTAVNVDSTGSQRFVVEADRVGQ